MGASFDLRIYVAVTSPYPWNRGVTSALKWIRKEARGSSCRAKTRRMALACTVYHIWNARNRRIFEGHAQEVDVTVFKIKLQVYRALFSLFPHECVEL